MSTAQQISDQSHHGESSTGVKVAASWLANGPAYAVSASTVRE